MKHKHLRPWLSVIVGGESLVSQRGWRRAGGCGPAQWPGEGVAVGLGRWRSPLAIHDPGKVVLDLATAVALDGDAACDVAVLRAQSGVFGLVASDPRVSRLITRLAGR